MAEVTNQIAGPYSAAIAGNAEIHLPARQLRQNLRYHNLQHTAAPPSAWLRISRPPCCTASLPRRALGSIGTATPGLVGVNLEGMAIRRPLQTDAGGPLLHGQPTCASLDSGP